MAYTSLASVKDYLGITTTGNDDLLTTLIAAAQAAIDRHTGRTFEASADSTKYFDAEYDTSESYTRLDWTPYGLDLCAITSVVNGDGTTITSTKYVTEPRHYTPYFAIKLKVSSGLYFTYDSDDDNEDAIAITGKWAYSTTAPAEVAQACLRWAAYLYRQKDSGTMDVVAVPGAGIIEVPQGIPKDVTMLLKPYRRLV